MKRREEMDLSKLLGFDRVSEELSGGIDFQNDAIEARLGAKVGKPDLAPVTLEEAGCKR